MPDPVKILLYPDPRLKKVSAPVTAFDQGLRELVGEMFKLMREAKGVGLAAPQVGENHRVFVMNPTGEAGDDRVYVNPALTEAEGSEEAEEGCLSLPDIHVKVVRSKKIRMQAQDIEGHAIDQTAAGFISRVWQHEFDHLNGILITDRMGPVAKMANRKKLKDLEDRYRNGR